MAMPCSPGLSPQSVWIVFSAPEITTVSKPKRNPASADVSDQKKMRPFIVKEVPSTEYREQTLRPALAPWKAEQKVRSSYWVPGIRYCLSSADIPSPANRECRHPSR